MRSKESAHDYRYFPEPDIIPIILDEDHIESIGNSLPEMPIVKKIRFTEQYGLSEKEVDIIIDDRCLSLYYESLVEYGANPKTAANWVLGDILRLLKQKELSSDDIPVKPEALSELIKMISTDKISITAGKEVFEEMFNTGKDADQVVKEKGLSQISDTDELGNMIKAILSKNPQSINDFAAGKTQAVGFLMGQIMKASKGKANPKVAKELLESLLKEKIN
jgi:aspartyl-tRNA(Asn)/glutamyl-tRNA(Gln) amidotransferase subunit B